MGGLPAGRSLAMVLTSFALALTVVPAVSFAAPRDFAALDPDGPARFDETVPVQVVFVGYEPHQVDRAGFEKELSHSADPVVRSRLWYGVKETLGLHYSFDYDVRYTDQAYEDAFFGQLSDLAEPAPRTAYQDAYNAEPGVLDVGQNHVIDAPSVEEWLYRNPPAGVDPDRNTVVFVNWWGRSDFKHHVYTKLGEPDPDTGFDFGAERDSRKIMAWGGTPPSDEETGFGETSRLWFYDLSAGPESWTDNWNVSEPDLNGDGRVDYRMPPIWEYLTSGGFRDASALAGDLGKVARYVAVNLLFAPSPLYPPYITPESQPASINLDLNTYEGWRGVDASAEYQSKDLLAQELAEVHRVRYTYDDQDLEFSDEARQCFVLFPAATCHPERPQYGQTGWPNLFLHNALNLGDSRDGGDGADYEAMFYNYASNDAQQDCCLGFADDNWIDGTQSFTFNFVSPGIVERGYGLTTTQIHEYGHHFGMSHPHDGYDSETGRDYGPSGDLYFAWSGDQVNSMMSYIDLNWDYSQFDLDNANRFQAAAYHRNANAIAADVLADPDADAAMSELRRADERFGAAQAASLRHDYVAMYDEAKRGYEHVRAAATLAGVTVRASANGWTVLPPERGRQEPVKRDYAYVDRFAGSKRLAR